MRSEFFQRAQPECWVRLHVLPQESKVSGTVDDQCTIAGLKWRVGNKKGGDKIVPRPLQLLLPPPLQFSLDIQVLHVQGVLFDELAARFHVFAHQCGKDGFGFRDIFQPHGEQCAALRVHRRLPQLFGAHFA